MQLKKLLKIDELGNERFRRLCEVHEVTPSVFHAVAVLGSGEICAVAYEHAKEEISDRELMNTVVQVANSGRFDAYLALEEMVLRDRTIDEETYDKIFGSIVLSGNISMVRHLIAKIPEVLHREPNWISAISFAAEYGACEMIQYLFQCMDADGTKREVDFDQLIRATRGYQRESCETLREIRAHRNSPRGQ